MFIWLELGTFHDEKPRQNVYKYLRNRMFIFVLYLLTFYIFIRSLGGPPVTHAGILVISNDDHFAKEIKAIWIFDHV